MTRTLTPAQDVEVDKRTGAQPMLLMEIGFTPVARLTTCGENVTWNGETWVASGATMTGIAPGTQGEGDAILSLPDHDNALFASLLATGWSGISVECWSLHGGPGAYAVADAKSIYTGFTNEMELNPMRVNLTCLSGGANALHSPRIRIQQPWFNHLPRHGQAIPGPGMTIYVEAPPV